MTKKPKGGTLSTSRLSDKKARPPKEKNLIKKMKVLLEAHRLRMSDHANRRGKSVTSFTTRFYRLLRAAGTMLSGIALTKSLTLGTTASRVKPSTVGS